MPEAPKIHAVADHITLWIADGSIHLKTCEPHGDPVEMNETEAAELADLLQELIAKI